MTRFLAGLILAATIGAILYAATIRKDRHPLLIDAASPVASPQMLFAPCPMTIQNIPSRRRSHA